MVLSVAPNSSGASIRPPGMRSMAALSFMRSGRGLADPLHHEEPQRFRTGIGDAVEIAGLGIHEIALLERDIPAVQMPGTAAGDHILELLVHMTVRGLQ